MKAVGVAKHNAMARAEGGSDRYGLKVSLALRFAFCLNINGH